MQTFKRLALSSYLLLSFFCFYSPQVCRAQLSDELYRRLPDSLRPVLPSLPTPSEASKILQHAFTLPDFSDKDYALTDQFCYEIAPHYLTENDPYSRLNFLFFLSYYLYNSSSLNARNKNTLRGSATASPSPHAEFGLKYCDIYLKEYAKWPEHTPLFMGNVLMFKAYFQTELDQYTSAFHTLTQMKDVAVEHQLIESEALANLTLSYLFGTLSLTDQAHTYLDSAIVALKIASKESTYVDWALGELVNVKQAKQKLFLEKFIETKHTPSSDSVFVIHNEIKTKAQNRYLRLLAASSHVMVSTLKYYNQEYLDAVAHLDSAGSVYANISSTSLGEQASVIRALSLWKLDQSAEKALALVNNLPLDVSVGQPVRWALEELANHELSRRNAEGVKHYQELITKFNERRHDLVVHGKKLEMEQLYKTMEKDKKIALLEEREIQHLSIAALVILFILFIFCAILNRYLQSRRRTNELLIRVEETMHRQLVEVEAARDRERKLIGQQLHDDLASSMAATLAYLRMVASNNEDPAEKERGMVVANMLEESYHKARGKSHDLYLENDSENFWNRLSEQVSILLSGSGIRFALTSEIDGVILSTETKTNLILIVKEIVTNVIKHSQASQMDLLLYIDNNYMVLEVIDNGKGFSRKFVKGGVGHKSINERVIKLGGRLEISSEKRSGTSITAKFPLDGSPSIVQQFPI